MTCCGALAITAAGCESTEQESSRIGREGERQAAASSGIVLGAPNHSVSVTQVTVVHGGGRAAVAARISSDAAYAQSALPLLLSVEGKAGRQLYSNAIPGLDPSLQHLGRLGARSATWWVDDQVLTSEAPSSVSLKVGSGRRASANAGALTAAGVRLAGSGAGETVAGEIVSGGGRMRRRVAVFAVALKNGRVVAAGRTIVRSLAGRSGARVPFSALLVGSAAGAKLEVDAVPSAG